MPRSLLFFVALAAAGSASAEPARYEIDASHTFPSFEADHLGGLSTWRGKFNTNSGSVTMDREAGSGEVEIVIDAASVDFGHDGMNAHALKEDILDIARFPRATYRGALVDFVDGAPTRVDGTLTLRGVSLPVPLTINRFKCMEPPRLKKEEEIKGRSLMVHAGGDNHADHPEPLGGGGARVACGVIGK